MICVRAPIFLVSALWLLALSAGAHAIEFRAIADEIAILHEAPSVQSGKSLILTRGYPVEVIIDSGDWVRVRDGSGSFAWIEAARLDTKRTVLVTADSATALENPNDAAPVVFRAEKGVVLEFLAVSGGWAKVRHQSGVIGFVPLATLWGV